MINGDLVGQRLGPYAIEGLVGRGTSAVVYRALNAEETVVALKVFMPSPSGEAEILLARFEREAQTAARLKHPNIVPVLDTGQVDGCAYMAMPLIKGETLEERIKKTSRFDELTVTEIGWQIADALNYAYENGVIHRDVKPSNIMLTPDGHALLTDFGVAHALDTPGLTQAGQIVGTPAYMAPEQALYGRQVEGRSDLYSLGVVLFKMITGQLPFRGSTPQMLHAHVYEPPPKPSTLTKISPEMEEIILQALRKNVAERFPDGRVMARALLELNSQLRSQKGPAPTWRVALKRWVTRLKRRGVTSLSQLI